MKSLGVTISGNRYNINLEDDFANFVNSDLMEAGVDLNVDNKPDKLLKAYLRLAKKLTNHESEIEALIDKLDY